MKLIQFRNKGLVFLLFFLISCTSAYSQETKVYVTDTGEKYHLKSCRYLKYSSNETTLKDAQDKGYEACKVCKPAGSNSTHSHSNADTQSTVTPKANTQQKTNIQYVTSRQCSATTQAGSRCKRMTKSSTGKCWQHE